MKETSLPSNATSYITIKVLQILSDSGKKPFDIDNKRRIGSKTGPKTQQLMDVILAWYKHSHPAGGRITLLAVLVASNPQIAKSDLNYRETGCPTIRDHCLNLNNLARVSWFPSSHYQPRPMERRLDHASSTLHILGGITHAQ